VIKVEPCYYHSQSFHFTYKGELLTFIRHEIDLQFVQDDISYYSNKEVWEVFNLYSGGRYMLFGDTLKIIHPSSVRVRSSEHSGFTGEEITVKVENQLYSPKLVGFVSEIREDQFLKFSLGDII
jgi:hypothetical protein